VRIEKVELLTPLPDGPAVVVRFGDPLPVITSSDASDGAVDGDQVMATMLADPSKLDGIPLIRLDGRRGNKQGKGGGKGDPDFHRFRFAVY